MSDDAKKIRLAKFIADAGITSKRDAERLIAGGAVTVNGDVVDTPVFFVTDNDKITVKGRAIAKRTETTVYAFYKPLDVITSNHDPMGRRTIYDVLPKKYRTLKYVGRLDFKTTGLLLLTDDGALARRLTLPATKIPRVYLAQVARPTHPIADAIAPARRGMTIDDIKYQAMTIDILAPLAKSDVLRLTLVEGKKNEIRIVLAKCGCPVQKLHRLSYGPVTLGNMTPGEIRPLTEEERKLVASVEC